MRLYYLLMPKIKYDKIKYDKRDKKLNFIVAIIFSILAVMDCCILACEAVIGQFSDEMAVAFICAIWPLSMLAIGLWAAYLDGVLYLKRLKRFGYVVPEDKRDFNKALEQLPKAENAIENKPVKNYGSIALTVLAGVIVIGLLIYDVCFFYRYSSLGNDIWFFEAGLIFCTFIWMLMGVCYGRQISDRRYKYDVEIDSNRKNRKNLIDGLVEIAFLLMFTLLSANMAIQAAQYAVNARKG